MTASRSGRSRPLLIASARICLGVIVVLGVVLNLSNVSSLLAYLPYSIVGSLLVVRRPRHLIGWLLLLMAAGFSIVGRQGDVSAAAIAPWLPLVAWLGTMAGIGILAGLALLSAVFPTGALPGGGIGRTTRAGLALIAGVALLQAVAPVFPQVLPDGTTVVIHNPIGIAPEWPGWSLLFYGPAYLVVLGGLAVCVVGLLVRFRRAGGIERQQDKWLVTSLALVAGAIAFGLVAGTFVDPEGAWIWIPALLAFPLPPVAIGIAITRYRLYDIDRIVSRTISYAAVTGLLVATYAGMILLIGGPLGEVTGGDTISVALSTLAVLALLQPVLRRVRRTVDRRFDRARYDAVRTIESLAGRLRADLDLATVSREIARTAEAAVRPASISVWLRKAPR